MRLPELLYPRKCPYCRCLLGKAEGLLCSRCRQELPYTGGRMHFHGSHFSRCISPLFYTKQVRTALLRFKFYRRSSYARCFGEQIANCVRENLVGCYDRITWVPISLPRMRTRGYCQSRLLALEAGRYLGQQPECLLKKHRHTPPQSHLRDAAARRANVSGAFAAMHPERLQGQRILLIDDVVTTGATLSECARVLRSAGAEEVVCATLCRSLPQKTRQ